MNSNITNNIYIQVNSCISYIRNSLLDLIVYCIMLLFFSIDCMICDLFPFNVFIPSIPKKYFLERQWKKKFDKYYINYKKTTGQKYRLSAYKRLTEQIGIDKYNRLRLGIISKGRFLSTKRCTIYRLPNSYKITCIAYDRDGGMPFDTDEVYTLDSNTDIIDVGNTIVEALSHTKTIKMPKYSSYNTNDWLCREFQVTSYDELFRTYPSCLISLDKNEFVFIPSIYDKSKESLINDTGNIRIMLRQGFTNEKIGEVVKTLMQNNNKI